MTAWQHPLDSGGAVGADEASDHGVAGGAPRAGAAMRQVGTKIRGAQRVLAARTRAATRDEAAEWLEHVRQAIERLNAAMHATRVVWVGRKHAEDRLGLGEMPRKGAPYFGRPLIVESLSELCSVLENAADG